MMRQILNLFFFALIFSCKNETVKIQNKLFAIDINSVSMVEELEIRFELDSLSARKPQNIQIIKNNNDRILFTFYNPINSSIYFYDLESMQFEKKIEFSNNDSNGIGNVIGYSALNKDSVCFFDFEKNNFILADLKNKDIIHKKSMFQGNNYEDYSWIDILPQLFPSTSTPLIRNNNNILFIGAHMWSIKDKQIPTFKFFGTYGLKNDSIQYKFTYPISLYGERFNWDDPIFNSPYYTFNEEEGKIVISFPVSHDLYLALYNQDTLSKVISGSKYSEYISPLNVDSKKVPTKSEMAEYIKNSDIYGPIFYDKDNLLYYRFVQYGITSLNESLTWEDKNYSIIILDNDLNYIGETEIGSHREWNVNNCFIADGGIYIEYLSENRLENEDFLFFKKFTPKFNE